MSNFFNRPRKVRAPQRARHDLSFDSCGSFNMGELIPDMVVDSVPSDTFHISASNFVRFAPMLRPIMHRINVRQYFFYVPYNILSSGWKSFIDGQDDTTPPPTLELGKLYKLCYQDSLVRKSAMPLMDWLGFQTTGNISDLYDLETPVNIFDFRAYYMIWREYFRDKELQTEDDYPVFDGNGPQDDDSSLQFHHIFQLRKRAWEKDYFTSSSTEPQLGDAVALPVAFPTYSLTNVPNGQQVSLVGDLSGHTQKILSESGVAPSFAVGNIGFFGMPGGGDGTLHFYRDAVGSAADHGRIFLDPTDTLRTDSKSLSTNYPGEVGTIPDLRMAEAMQRIAERGLFGENYHDWLYSTFGVSDGDDSLTRPIFLGGFSNPVSISEVTQTSATEIDEQEETISPLGDMSGHGISAGGSRRGITFTCNGYGVIMGILVVSPRSKYMTGIPRRCFRVDRFDFFNPMFCGLGQQEIRNRELFISDNDDDNDAIFGYTDRYAEYKFHPSEVHGQFRSTMKDWHLARDFDSMPALNESFITQNPRTDIFAVTDPDEHHVFVNLFFRIHSVRPIPFNNNLGF